MKSVDTSQDRGPITYVSYGREIIRVPKNRLRFLSYKRVCHIGFAVYLYTCNLEGYLYITVTEIFAIFFSF
jgi:hypothetical protein